MSQDQPWLDWVPGVLSADQVRTLRDEGYIRGLPDDRLGESAFDLTIGDTAWELTDGAVKPNGPDYLEQLNAEGLIRPLIVADDVFRLERNRTYLLQLAQFLAHRKELASAGFSGQATAKSTIGRLDVLARFVLDGMVGYENFEPSALEAGNGSMFLEVTPLTFPLRVKRGKSLSQLRLFYGHPDDVEIRGDLLWRTVVRGRDEAAKDKMLSVCIKPHLVGGLKAVAFATRRADDPSPLDSWERNKYDPCDHWRVLDANEPDRLRLEPSQFYILRSQERLWLPADVAAYCRATDETIGEMRIHYAGFVHPHFGVGRTDGQKGTPLIFEVRGHDFQANLRDGEKMARLVFYRMSRPAPEPIDVTYRDQELKLSGLFKEWPVRLRRAADNGIVEPEP